MSKQLKSEPAKVIRRRITHCKRGHKFTKSNTYVAPKTGFRGCIKCRKLSTRGKARPALESPYYGMHDRCDNPNNKRYPTYGGRGIRVCARWSGKDGFRNFAQDMGEKPSPQHTLDRIDNNGNYEPGNCRWATVKEQALNRNNNVYLTYCGITRRLIEWAELLQVAPSVFYNRRSLDLSDAELIEKPPRGYPGYNDRLVKLRAEQREYLSKLGGK